MINKKGIIVALTLSIMSFSAFAATGSTGGTGDISSGTTNTIDTGSSLDSDPLADDTGSIDSIDSSLNSAENSASGALAVPKGGIGNYTEIACDKDYFSINSCNQCFNGGKKAVGEKITNLIDSWTNPNSSEQVIYKDEQTMPELINLGGNGTTWISNPEDSSKFWKFSDEIVWTDSKKSGTQEFINDGGKTVNFLEGDLGATYVMTATDKKEGEPTGLLKFNIAYHNIDESGIESAKLNHIECVAYSAAPQAAKAPAPQPKEVTKVKTGPELYILFILAFAIAFGFVKLRKKI